MDLMSQIRALEGPVIDRKRLTSMSSRDVARERNNETFAKQIKKRVGILRNVSIFKEMSDEELAKAAEAFAEVMSDYILVSQTSNLIADAIFPSLP